MIEDRTLDVHAIFEEARRKIYQILAEDDQTT